MEQMLPEQSECKEMDAFGHKEDWSVYFQTPSCTVVKRMKTNDDKSLTDSHTKSVEDEAYNEKVVRSELLSSIERMTPAAKIIGMEDFFMASHKKVWTCPCIGVDQGRPGLFSIMRSS